MAKRMFRQPQKAWCGVVAVWNILAKRVARKKEYGNNEKVQHAMTVEWIRLGVKVGCILFDYTNSTMLPPEMGLHKRDGIVQKWDKIPEMCEEWTRS